MALLELSLLKEGDVAPKLELSLEKGERFKVRLAWDGGTDLDLHAFVATNAGAGAKVETLADVLSTYNVKRVIRGKTVGTLDKNPDGTFQIRGGALLHSKDAQTGVAGGDDEFITILPDDLQLPTVGVLEIPLIAMIHPQSGGKTFRDVQNARVIIENAAGQELMNVSLSSQFGEFVGVQMGSIMVEPDSSSFAAIGVGFNNDFQQVLHHFA